MKGAGGILPPGVLIKFNIMKCPSLEGCYSEKHMSQNKTTFIKFCFTLLLVMVFFIVAGPPVESAVKNPQANNEKALDLIKESAGDICKQMKETPSIKNLERTKKTQTLLEKLTVRLSKMQAGVASLYTDKYSQEELQDQLIGAFKNIKTCRQEVYYRIQETLIPSQSAIELDELIKKQKKKEVEEEDTFSEDESPEAPKPKTKGDIVVKGNTKTNIKQGVVIQNNTVINKNSTNLGTINKNSPNIGSIKTKSGSYNSHSTGTGTGKGYVTTGKVLTKKTKKKKKKRRPAKPKMAQKKVKPKSTPGPPPVVVEIEPKPDSPVTVRSGGQRLTGRAFLVRKDVEQPGYGLYSYIVFAKPVNAGNADLYTAVLKAFLKLETVQDFEAHGVERQELNITYLPLDKSYPIGKLPAPKWFLQHYDYARAKVLLRAIPEVKGDGPFIFSYKAPLNSKTEIDPEMMLRQDLSGVPPRLAFLWVDEFVNQAQKENYWDSSILASFKLGLRKTIAVAAEAFTEVKSAHAEVLDFMEKIK